MSSSIADNSRHDADTHALRQTIPSLPLDIIDYIGKILIDDYQFGTVAALNVVSKDVRACTLVTLWRTVNLDAREGMKEFLEGDLWKRMIKSPGCRYTWYVPCQYQRQVLTSHRFLDIHLSPSDLDTTIARKETIMHLQLSRRFPSARAIIFNQYFRGSRAVNWTSSPYIENDVHLLPRYHANDVDDLFLWAIVGREQEVQSHVFISPPSSGFARVTDGPRIIPFTTKRRGMVRSIHLGSWTPKVHDPKVVAAAFCTCLAMASYAGGLWSNERGEEDDTAPGRTAVSVMSGTDDLAVQTCIENVSIRSSRRISADIPYLVLDCNIDQ